MSLLLAGLTGQTGAGKSSVCRYFREAGIPVIDCDQVARKVTAAGGECLDAIAAAFGPEILLPEGSLDRRALGRRVFSNREELDRLNGLIFPFITADIRRQADALETQGQPAAVLDAPTLFESGADALCGCIIAVTAPEEIRLARIMARDNLTRSDALARMHSQLGEDFFRTHSDFLIENGGDEATLASLAREAAAFVLHKSRG